ncbi:MAG TPA: hypothetical protein VGT04_09915 [Acidobacteriaceae bacterium]|nr:hypothetical protein [Acidobacteriaceae bacterium]
MPERKKPAGRLRRRALGFLIFRPLVQAIQIRRHARRMMMVVLTMMAMNLHLQLKLYGCGRDVNPVLAHLTERDKAINRERPQAYDHSSDTKVSGIPGFHDHTGSCVAPNQLALHVRVISSSPFDQHICFQDADCPEDIQNQTYRR